jgi:hypothetical protein
MMSLFNSGYKKEEIEDAAKTLMVSQSETFPNLMGTNPVKAPETKPAMPPGAPASFKVKQLPKTPEAKVSPKASLLSKQPLVQAEKSFSELEAGRAQPELQKQKPKPEPQVKLQAVKQIKGSRLSQRVSNYGDEDQKEKLREKGILFVLFFLLVLLAGLLVAIFLFKDQLINLLSTLFG